MADIEITKMHNGKTEIPKEIINKFEMYETSLIEWSVTRNGDVVLHIRPDVKLAP